MKSKNICLSYPDNIMSYKFERFTKYETKVAFKITNNNTTLYLDCVKNYVQLRTYCGAYDQRYMSMDKILDELKEHCRKDDYEIILKELLKLSL